MKTTSFHHSKLSAAILSAVLASSLAGIAQAADFSARIESEIRSASVGIGRDSVELLRRVQGPGAEAIAAIALQRFKVDTLRNEIHEHAMQQVAEQLKGSAAALQQAGIQLPAIYTSENFEKMVRDNEVAYIGEEGWDLQVFGDGTSVRYRNYAHLDGIRDQVRTVEQRFSKEELEKMGREFIEKQLAGAINLGPGEALVPYFTQFEITGGGSIDQDAPMQAEIVHTSTMVFTRSIDGLPVIGGGSKVAVIFANDGQAIGFDFDWPQYQASQELQRVLSLSQVKERGLEYAKHAFDDPQVQELHFDCGYVDFGARKRDQDAPVQSGCMRQTLKRQIVDAAAHEQDENSGHIVTASLDFIPAGETVQDDAVWARAKVEAADIPDALQP